MTCGILTSSILFGCALGRNLEKSEDAASQKTPEQVKIETLESQVIQLQGKLEKVEQEVLANQKSLAPRTNSGLVESTELVQSSVALSDPERGFVQDTSVLSLRQSKILFDSEKYPEAILGFSTFVEKNARHPLASQAQYYLADAYFRQNDFPVAEKEFRKLLQNYPQSSLAFRGREKLKACLEKSRPAAPRSQPAPSPSETQESASPSTPNSAAREPETINTSQSSAAPRSLRLNELDLAPMEDAPSEIME
jgi:tetratricopeptide (TPR) repeat protein